MTKPLLPREVVIDRMLMDVNGPSIDPRPGVLTRDRAGHTIDLMKAAFENPLGLDDLPETMRKDVSVATGLTFYDLRAPALNLFPTVTPLRNSIPRAQRENPGDAAHWKSVDATTGSGFPFMGWVPEGQRSASMSYTTSNHSLPYATLGEEDSLTDEARFAAKGFEDEDALVQLRLMLKTFVKEEAAILGGNASLSLSAPGQPATSASGSGSSLTTTTYYVICVALTMEGYLNSSLSGGVATQLNITGNDGKTFTLNGGCSAQSTEKSQSVTSGNTLFASVGAVNGAVAYAWYAGTTSGAETLQAITTINSVGITAITGGRQSVTAVSGNFSRNQSYAYDGLLTQAFNSGNAYIQVLATGTAGTGTVLTASGVGSVNEIDTMLKSMWDNFRISPTVIYVNSQELKNITAKVLSNSSAPLLRYNVEADADGMAEYKLTAAGMISFYFNPFTADGGAKIPVKIHPNLPPGTIIAWSEKLPPWYVSNNVPAVAQMLTRQDYYTEVWPKTSRQQYYGTYVQEALAVYATFGLGIITNIANG